MPYNQRSPLRPSPNGLWYGLSEPFIDAPGVRLSIPPLVPCRSYVRNWVQIFRAFMGTDPTNWTTTDLVPVSRAWAIAQMDVEAAAADDAFGIVVGDGGPMTTIDTFRLNSQIPQTGGPPTINHGACSITSTIIENDRYGFLLQRQLTATGAAASNINELALYVSDGVDAFMVVGDNLVTPYVLEPPFSVLIQYLIQTELVIP